MIGRFVERVGPLRVLLTLSTLIVIGFSPFTGDRAILEGWAIVPTLIVPAIVPILFFVIWLDILMASVFMSDQAEAAGKARFRFIVRMDLVLVVLLSASWARFFLSIAQ